jgi:predicted DsbA family dithiol-disulfide isomerase
MIRANYPRLQKRAADLGLPLGASLPPLGVDTRPAHEAGKFVLAHAPEQVRAFHRAAFQAHFVDGKRLSDPAVLADLVGALGLDGGALKASLASGEFSAQVDADLREARALGIGGVPQLFINGQALPTGMLTAGALLDAAQAALAG